LSPAQMSLMERRFGVPVLEAYGMTEASHQMASNPLPPDARFAGSVGRGTGVDIAVFDEAGTRLPAGTSGEVVIRGPNVLQGAEAFAHRRIHPAHSHRKGPAPVRRRAARASVKLVVLGAGAIGGFLGARLARAGVDVTLIARGPHLKAMSESGIRVIDAGGEWTVPVDATDDFAAMRDADTVFVTLKAHSLPAVADRMAANLGPETVIVSGQNGIPWWYCQPPG